MCDYNLQDIFSFTDKKEALSWKQSYIRYIREENTEIDGDYQKAVEIANSNIGYFADYGTREDRERVEELFETQHPFLGKAKDKQHTAEEIFNIGYELGKKLKDVK